MNKVLSSTNVWDVNSSSNVVLQIHEYHFVSHVKVSEVNLKSRSTQFSFRLNGTREKLLSAEASTFDL